MTNFKTYILPYMKKYQRLMVATLILGLLSVLSAIMLTFTSGYLISKAALRPETILLVYVPIVGVRTFGLSRAVFRYLERLFSHNAVLHILSDMRVRFYRALEPQALFIRSRFKTGDILGTLADDIEHLQDYYIRTIFPTLIGLFLYIFIVITAGTIDWLFAGFLLFSMGLVVFVYPMVSLYFMKKHQLRAKTIQSQLYNQLVDAFFGLHDWIISRREKDFLEAFEAQNDERLSVERRLARWNRSRTFQLQLLSGVIVIVTGIWAGIQASNGVIEPAYIAAFTLAIIPIMEALMPISQGVEKLPFYEESMHRIDAVHTHVQAEQKVKIVPPANDELSIEFNNVTYSYEGQQVPAVRNVNLKITPGQKVAILGRSGSGKSTLMQLLLGAIQPSTGEVLINHHNASDYGERIYDMLGVLNQKPYLFATSVENNLRIGRKSATKAELEHISEQIGLHQYMQSLPNGLKTQMEESGQRFSGGERQRIALGRILLKETPIVIMDEPTVGLDIQTETDLVETIFDSLQNQTVIWITHHLTAIEKMDWIVFMDEGEIVMEGTHEMLMASNARYRRLFELDRAI